MSLFEGCTASTHCVASVAQHKDTFWAEPKNNNPLEKTTTMRETFGGESPDQKAEGSVCPCCDYSEAALCRNIFSAGMRE